MKVKRRTIFPISRAAGSILLILCTLCLLAKPYSYEIQKEDGQQVEQKTPDSESSGDHKDGGFEKSGVYFPAYKSTLGDWSTTPYLIAHLPLVRGCENHKIIPEQVSGFTSGFRKILFSFIIAPNAP